MDNQQHLFYQIFHQQPQMNLQQQSHSAYHPNRVYQPLLPQMPVQQPLLGIQEFRPPPMSTSPALPPGPSANAMQLRADEIANKLQQDLSDGVEKALLRFNEQAEQTCKSVFERISNSADGISKSAESAFLNIEAVGKNMTDNISKSGLASVHNINTAGRDIVSSAIKKINEAEENSLKKIESAANVLASKLIQDGDNSLDQIDSARDKSIQVLKTEADLLLSKISAPQRTTNNSFSSKFGSSSEKQTPLSLRSKYNFKFGGSSSASEVPGTSSSFMPSQETTETSYAFMPSPETSSAFMAEPSTLSMDITETSSNIKFNGKRCKGKSSRDEDADEKQCLTEPIVINDMSDSDSEKEVPAKKSKQPLTFTDVKKLLSKKIPNDPVGAKPSTSGGVLKPTTKRVATIVSDEDDNDNAAVGVDDDFDASDDCGEISLKDLKKMRKDALVNWVQENLKDKDQASEEKQEPPECLVCLGRFLDPISLHCGHKFCKICITEWWKVKVSCPLCRHQPDVICVS